jgi:hypothetical protein
MPVALLEDDPVVAEVLARVESDFERWEEQVAHTGHCLHPVRLRGRIRQVDKATGEVRETYTTEHEPDQTLLKACGCRWETRCPSCSATKRADSYQLVAAGLRGGKGVPESVEGHPKLFVTFTAPSFGAVHSRVTRRGRVRACHPRQNAARCPHGRLLECRRRHGEGDASLGSPLCPKCFDWEGQVIWNAVAPELWRRTPDYIRRALARLCGMNMAELRRVVRLSFFKAAELQHRGAIHFHAIFRLDAAPPEEDRKLVGAPPEGFTAELLAEAVRQAAEAVSAPHPAISRERPGGWARWGEQLHIRNIAADGAGELNAKAVALYVGKYATKAPEGFEGLDHRLKETEIDCLRGPERVTRLVQTAWVLGGRRSLEELRLRPWAHQLGFGGHWHTKSRVFSTSFGALQRARVQHVWRSRAKEGVPLDAWGRPEDEEAVVVIREWSVTGFGYQTEGEMVLALSAAARARERRQAAREERYWTTEAA